MWSSFAEALKFNPLLYLQIGPQFVHSFESFFHFGHLFTVFSVKNKFQTPNRRYSLVYAVFVQLNLNTI